MDGESSFFDSSIVIYLYIVVGIQTCDNHMTFIFVLNIAGGLSELDTIGPCDKERIVLSD